MEASAKELTQALKFYRNYQNRQQRQVDRTKIPILRPGLFNPGDDEPEEDDEPSAPPTRVVQVDHRPASDGSTVGLLQLFSAMLAESFRDMQEELRPNKVDGLIAAVNPIATTASQACTAVNLAAGAQIVAFVGCAGDSALTWSAFGVDGFAVIGSGQVPNDIFYPSGVLEKLLLPFANRVFENQAAITGTVVNQSAANAYHHGLGILTIDARCQMAKGKMSIAPRHVTIGRVKERVMNLLKTDALSNMRAIFT